MPSWVCFVTEKVVWPSMNPWNVCQICQIRKAVPLRYTEICKSCFLVHFNFIQHSIIIAIVSAVVKNWKSPHLVLDQLKMGGSVKIVYLLLFAYLTCKTNIYFQIIFCVSRSAVVCLIIERQDLIKPVTVNHGWATIQKNPCLIKLLKILIGDGCIMFDQLIKITFSSSVKSLSINIWNHFLFWFGFIQYFSHFKKC